MFLREPQLPKNNRKKTTVKKALEALYYLFDSAPNVNFDFLETPKSPEKFPRPPCGDFPAMSQPPLHPQRSDRSGSGAKRHIRHPTPKDRHAMHFGTRGVLSPPEWILGGNGKSGRGNSRAGRSGGIAQQLHIGIWMGTLEPLGTPPRGGWCGDLRLRCPEKVCTLGAVRGRFMLAASLPAVRFRQPIRPGYARATRVRQGRDTLWGCPERAYGCCDAGTGPWGIRKTRGFHLPCGGAGQAIVEKKAFLGVSKYR